MAKTKDYRLGEFTYPRGWFMIAEDKELDTHKPLAVRFFGQDFALYRGMASGKVVLLDAYCPHMQTHLGAHNTTSYVVLDNNGTNIVGDDIVCPYHGWKFGADGVCKEIPYHDGPIPAAARVKTQPIVLRHFHRLALENILALNARRYPIADKSLEYCASCRQRHRHNLRAAENRARSLQVRLKSDVVAGRWY